MDGLWHVVMGDEMGYLKRISIVSDLEVAGVVEELLKKVTDEGVRLLRAEAIPKSETL